MERENGVNSNSITSGFYVHGGIKWAYELSKSSTRTPILKHLKTSDDTRSSIMLYTYDLKLFSHDLIIALT